MNTLLKIGLLLCLQMTLFVLPVRSQDKAFTLDECIEYALENNTTVGRATNEIESHKSYLEQRKAAQGPDLSMSADDTWSSSNSHSNTYSTWSRNTGSDLSLGLSSDLTLYNGASLKNSINQGKVNLSAAEINVKTQKELLSLDVLAAYIDVMQAKEQVQNSQLQVETTQKELEEATIRREAGVMAPADYLNIKSEYSSDKADLVSAQSDLRISLVSLMQLMNMPVVSSFDIEDVDLEALLKASPITDPSTVYSVAVGIQPSIKTAELDVKSADFDIKLAKAAALPTLSLSGSLYSYYDEDVHVNFGGQLSHAITPSIGLSLSVPIYQRKEVKNNIKQATIQKQSYEFDLLDIKNDLRKAIEQVCTNSQTANITFSSYQEQLEAEQESYKLAQKMFAEGMLSSTDFLTSKNNLYEAEINLTSSKYDVLLENEILEYYMGEPIGF
jgi:outer membrane protein